MAFPPRLSFLLCASSLIATCTCNFYQGFEVTWGDDRVKISNNGELLTLSMDKASGSGFRTKNAYRLGKFDMQLKLVPGNSAGTVTAYYLSSEGPSHDEIDFEFLGNLSGEPYIIHTNLYTQGKGDREQQFYLWFDPTKDFHNYSILWNSLHIALYVDGIPIREFKNIENSTGVPYPKNKLMRMYSSLWNGEDWATRGGQVKTDWTQAPFIASFQNFKADACVWLYGISSCSDRSRAPSPSNYTWMKQELDSVGLQQLRSVQKNYMVYNYCTDVKRFPQGIPPECSVNP